MILAAFSSFYFSQGTWILQGLKFGPVITKKWTSGLKFDTQTEGLGISIGSNHKKKSPPVPPKDAEELPCNGFTKRAIAGGEAKPRSSAENILGGHLNRPPFLSEFYPICDLTFCFI